MEGKDNTRSIITFATNKEAYFDFAINCAKSVQLFNNILVYIVTNLDVQIPSALKDHVFKLPAKPEHATLGIGIKLYVDQYLQTDETLFIDSDCLCYSSLDTIFDAAKEQSVTVVGTVVDAAVFCGDEQAKTINEAFNIDKLIRFNGGLYYLKKSEICTHVFDLARSIIPKYDSLGFHRINKTTLNEEGLLSIAMTIYEQKPIKDNGTYMTDLSTEYHPFALNVLNGKSMLNNPDQGLPQHRSWYPVGKYQPIVLHFGGNSLKTHPYIGQNLLLRLKSVGLPNFLSTLLTMLSIEIPYYIYYKLCGLLKK